MKRNYVIIVGVVWLLNACNVGQSNTKEKEKEKETEPTELENNYFGQVPPGLTPVPFAPNLVSTPAYQYGGTFTPDLQEFYYLRGDQDAAQQQLVVVFQKNNQWTDSIVSARPGQPIISPDGQTMHLGRRFKERTKTGWSDVQLLNAPFNEFFIMRLSVSAKGTYFFDTYDENNPDFPIRYSTLENGTRQAPRALSKAINTGTQMNHPFIAPDESYLLWDAKREEGHGDSDIYVSFRQKDGSWGNAINLGDKVNTNGWDAAASVTPDGKYLFFNRLIQQGKEEALPDVDIFWVDAQVIEQLRPN